MLCFDIVCYVWENMGMANPEKMPICVTSRATTCQKSVQVELPCRMLELGRCYPLMREMEILNENGGSLDLVDIARVKKVAHEDCPASTLWVDSDADAVEVNEWFWEEVRKNRRF